MILNPLGKQLDLPTLAIQCHHDLGYGREVVNQEKYALAGIVLDHNAPQRRWVALAPIKHRPYTVRSRITFAS